MALGRFSVSWLSVSLRSPVLPLYLVSVALVKCLIGIFVIDFPCKRTMHFFMFVQSTLQIELIQERNRSAFIQDISLEAEKRGFLCFLLVQSSNGTTITDRDPGKKKTFD